MKLFAAALLFLAAPFSVARANAIYGNFTENGYPGVTMVLAHGDPETQCANVGNIPDPTYEVLQLIHADSSLPVGPGYYFIVNRIAATDPSTRPLALALLDIRSINEWGEPVDFEVSHGLVTIYEGSAANNDPLVGQLVASLGGGSMRREFEAQHCWALDGVAAAYRR